MRARGPPPISGGWSLQSLAYHPFERIVRGMATEMDAAQEAYLAALSGLGPYVSEKMQKAGELALALLEQEAHEANDRAAVVYRTMELVRLYSRD